MTRDQIISFVRLRAHDPAFILAIIEQESDFNERAIANDRNGGSFGLMQLNIPTAIDMGISHMIPNAQRSAEGIRLAVSQALLDPEINLQIGMKYLDWIASFLKKRNAFTFEKQIAAYNAGVGNILKGALDTPYVNSVLKRYKKWQNLGS